MPNLATDLARVMDNPLLIELHERMLHALHAAEEGVDYAMSRETLCALTELGFMFQEGKGRWASWGLTEAGRAFANARLPQLRAQISIWNTRAASGGLNEPFGNPERLGMNEQSGNSRQLPSLEQRARELLAREYEAAQLYETGDGLRSGLETDAHGKLALRAIAAALELADKFMWQVRDTCVRAEKAEAALANQQGVGGWQLIETAPKDGREILLAVVSVYGWSLVIATWESYGWVDAEMRSVERNNYKAAHWMPLPEPPTQPAGDVGREG